MGVNDPHNLSKQLSNQQDKLDALCDADADMIWDFGKVAEKEMAASTAVQYLSKLRTISEHASRPLAGLSPREIDGVIDDLQDERDWSDGTRRNYEKAVRVLFRELRAADPDEFDADYTDLPSHASIRLTSRDEKKVTPDDVLTQQQITELLQDAAQNARDRAMIAFLTDTGVRIAAMLSLRIQDVDIRDDGEGGRYTVNQQAVGQKGDEGTKPITWAAAHVDNYLHGGEHPRPDDDSAPLIHKSEGWCEDPDDDGSMTPARVRQRLRRLCEPEDISVDPEEISPHLFRHTAVSIWAEQGFTDREIKHRAGWSRDSDMLDKYEHIKDETINKQVLKKYGIDVEDDGIGEPELDRCPRCNAPLQGGENYCPRCSAGLVNPGPDRGVEEVLGEQLREMDGRMLRGDREAYMAALDGAGADGDDGPSPGEMQEIVDDLGHQVVRELVDREHKNTLVAEYDVRLRV